MINKILEAFSIPLIIMNIGSSIIGGFWLAILGQWKLIGIGVGILFTSQWIISIFMIPAMPIGAIAAYFYNKNSIMAPIFAYISQLYINLLIVASCGLALFVCFFSYKGEFGLGSIPYLLWSWTMALGGWQYLASKDQENVYSLFYTFSASVFYFLILLSLFISSIFTVILWIIFGLVQLIILPIYNLYLVKKDKSFLN